MGLQKSTVFLMPDEDGYQVIVPHYPECTTWGETPEKAFAMAKEAMELILEVEAEANQEQILPGVYASHVVVGTIDVEVPDVLLKDLRAAETEGSEDRVEVPVDAN